MIKNISKQLLFALALSAPLTSCNDWLDLLPNNEQVFDKYWKSKEDVEQVVATGYYYMRTTVPTLLNWGELRGDDFYNVLSGSKANKMQDFDMLPSNDLCSWSAFYQVIAQANSVLEYAPQVDDKTYYTSMMYSHLCEAYFQRAWAYSILVKNFKEVPLQLNATVSDASPVRVVKDSESRIIAQIKEDIRAALALGSAKGYYEEAWQTKGRATKWALYALMADICLWNHDYDECIEYANYILNATDAFRPVFISETSKWFDIFYPGLSNESIFELYWDYNTENAKNNFTDKFPGIGVLEGHTDGRLNFTSTACKKMEAEMINVLANNKGMTTSERLGRTVNASYVAYSTINMTNAWMWKYRGTDIVDNNTVRVHDDADFILYRVADVMLMKAEALTMKGRASWKAAIQIINTIRTRAALPVFVNLEDADAEQTIETLTQWDMLSEILSQREMEFLGEGHRWYDILRLARYDSRFAPENTVEDLEESGYESYKTKGMGDDSFKYKELALNIILEGNTTTSKAQLRSVLQNSWAWYLPIQQRDIDCDEYLKQNPYYE